MTPPSPLVKTRSYLLAERFKVLAHPLRLHIITLLAEGEQMPAMLAAMLDEADNTITWHLRQLEAAGIVRWRRDKHRRWYRLADRSVLVVIKAGLKASV
jgi:DNA-binding transcriptional ArsR family regulator